MILLLILGYLSLVAAFCLLVNTPDEA